ncbi:ABC transporter permease [Elioraea tepida]|uniref:ABC transporter permease n=1 Tax=Elioraea tepida TaxID=2843330 RepID=A0A975U3Q6_9PROT|nr:ABC transporter permease [Elioraea tepida]QXM25820.1 ABC transporter permease [Elioraea tepida]
MLRYTARRLLAAIPVLFVVSLVSFAIIALVPGDIASEMAGPSATAEELARLRAELGLDKPILERMVEWYGALLRGDLGQSVLLRRSVTEAILERLPVTLGLTVLALAVAIVLGVLAGMVAAVRPNTWTDQGVMALALVGLSLPDFWLGLVFIWLFAIELGWLPTGGYVPFTEDPLGWLRAMAMPAGALALTQMGLLARMTRASMLEVLRQDYVRTARAKGLPGWVVVGRHAWANVLVPVITVAGVSVGILLGGAVVIEQVFSLPGVGRLIIGAIQRRDYPVIQGGLLLTATIFVLVNLVVDLLYAAVDPRVRYGR